MKKHFLLLFAAALAATLSLPALAFASEEALDPETLSAEVETLGSNPIPSDENFVMMFRLYNPYTGEHFYTGSWDERDTTIWGGWVYEGVGWIAPAKSNTPVYRLYNMYAGDHHYTINAVERDALVKAGWTYEGIGWYSDDKKSCPLYRQYNPYAWTGTHNYTTNKSEASSLVIAGWKDEGIGWYGVGTGHPLSDISTISGCKWVEAGEGYGSTVDDAFKNFTTESAGQQEIQAKTNGTLIFTFPDIQYSQTWTVGQYSDNVWYFNSNGDFVAYTPETKQLTLVGTTTDTKQKHVVVFNKK